MHYCQSQKDRQKNEQKKRALPNARKQKLAAILRKWPRGRYDGENWRGGETGRGGERGRGSEAGRGGEAGHGV